jgi:hypothetical protein
VTPQDEELKDKVEGAALLTGGTVAGAGVSAVVGGMGLVGGFGGVAIGMAPVAAAGAVVGTAAYGAKKAIEEGDATAIGAVAGGAAAGAGVAAVVGGMGLALGGTAVAIGMAPVAAAGAVVGLAAYGLNRLFNKYPSLEIEICKAPEITGEDEIYLVLRPTLNIHILGINLASQLFGTNSRISMLIERNTNSGLFSITNMEEV